MPPAAILDPSSIDFKNCIANAAQVRKVNPHRYDMIQLDGILRIDDDPPLIIGYKDVREDEFWVRGHMPGYPLFPGVLMCEAAAQLVSYYAKTRNVMGDALLGLGGLENVKFRGPVVPGDRFLMIGKGIKVHRRQTSFSVQGFVKDMMVFHGDVIGNPIPGGNEIASAIAANIDLQ